MLFRKTLSAVALMLAVTSVSLVASAQITMQAEAQRMGQSRSPGRAFPGSTTPAVATAARTSRLIIKFKDEAAAGVGTRISPQAALSGRERIAALNASGQLAYLKSVTRQTHVALTSQPLTRAEMASLTRQLAQDPRVEYAEMDEKAYPHFAINDPLYNPTTMWNFQAPGLYAGGANLTNAWNRTAGGNPVSGAGVVIAVLDTGYLPHADLTANLVSGYDFVSDPADRDPVPGRDGDARDPGNWNADATIADCPVRDSTWHGTRVAGIISATGNNHAGSIGAAYGAKVLPVRVLGACGGYISDIAAGIYWAAGLHVDGVPDNTAHVARVINLSLGASGACSNTFQSAVAAVRSAGSVVVASTGNDGSLNTITQPANCAGVIAVTAHTSTGVSPSYASVGPGTTLSAPGGISYPNAPADGNGIFSTANTGTTVPVADAYTYGSGTSFAAPHVAAVAALLFQAKPTITPDELQSRLTSSARAFPTGLYSYCDGKTTCGAGLLDADAALALVQADTAPYTHASANRPNPVARGVTVQLTGIATPGAGSGMGTTISSVAWTQIAGPTVDITGGNTTVASFTTPAIATSSDLLVFRFRATSADPVSLVTRTSDSLVFVTLAPFLAPPPPPPPSGGGGGGTLQWGELLALLTLCSRVWVMRRQSGTTPSQGK
jgi:serine protease